MASGSSSTIVDLANAIAKDTATVKEYFANNGLPEPTFQSDGPSDVRIPPSVPEAAAAQSRAIEACRELSLLLQGPSAGTRTILQINDLLVLQFIHRFKIAEAVPPGEAISFSDLARVTQVDESTLTRFLRYAFTQWMFKETRPGFVGHTARSKLLHDSHAARFMLGFGANEGMSGAFHMVNAIEKWGASQEPIESGWGLANGATQPFYTELALRHPERSATVAGAMDSMSAMMPLGPLFDAYDLSAANETAQIVDIGGGHGSVSIAIAKRYPQLHCIVQDVEQAIAAGEAKRNDLEESVRRRIEYQVHDIFEEQPVKGADIYYMRAIMHNWSDKYCVKLLKALVPAMKKGSRLVVNDSVMGEPGTMPASIERLRRAGDLNMMIFFNARERTLADWKDLFAQADERFHFQECRWVGKGPQAFMMPAVMEAIWDS